MGINELNYRSVVLHKKREAETGQIVNVRRVKEEKTKEEGGEKAINGDGTLKTGGKKVQRKGNDK